MPTTLITTVQGIGLGVMGQALAEHVPEIIAIAGVRGRSDTAAQELIFPGRCTLMVSNGGIPIDNVPANTKVLYIEQSYGLSRLLRARGQHTIFVPMWEAGLTKDEARLASDLVAVTRHTERQVGGTYLPWPVTLRERRPVTRVRRILHNAGSLGGNWRKGTLHAIAMYQKANLWKQGVQFIVHSWMKPPEEAVHLIRLQPDGIQWTNTFLSRADDVYSVYKPDLLLMPSKIEGHALVALEAMARGIPTLVTDVAPINEYELDPDFRIPVAGYQASPLAGPYAVVDVDAGADRLRDLCSRDLSDKSRQVHAFVEKEMSWWAIGARWRALCA